MFYGIFYLYFGEVISDFIVILLNDYNISARLGIPKLFCFNFNSKANIMNT